MSEFKFIAEAISRIDDSLVRIEGKVDSINLNGCAQRASDELRIKTVEEKVDKAEGWVKRGIIGAVSGLSALVILLLKFIFQVR